MINWLIYKLKNLKVVSIGLVSIVGLSVGINHIAEEKKNNLTPLSISDSVLSDQQHLKEHEVDENVTDKIKPYPSINLFEYKEMLKIDYFNSQVGPPADNSTASANTRVINVDSETINKAASEKTLFSSPTVWETLIQKDSYPTLLTSLAQKEGFTLKNSEQAPTNINRSFKKNNDVNMNSALELFSFWYQKLHLIPHQPLLQNYKFFFEGTKTDKDAKKQLEKLPTPSTTSPKKEIPLNSFYLDLIHSLLEEASVRELIIRPDISIGMKLSSSIWNLQEAYRPISSFLFSFTVVNLNEISKTLFSGFKIPPNSENRVTISLAKGRIYHTVKNMAINLVAGSSWVVIPEEQDGDPSYYEITLQSIINKNEVQHFYTPYLKLIYSDSKIYPHLISLYSEDASINNKITFPSPTLQDLQREVGPALKNITYQNIIKDIKSWHAFEYTMLFQLFLNDFTSLINLLTTKIDPLPDGTKISILQKFYDSPSFRNAIYSQIKLPSEIIRIIENILYVWNTSSKDSSKPANSTVTFPKMLESFLRGLKHSLSEVMNNTTIELILPQEKDVKIHYNPQNELYLSFEFTRKQKYNKEIKFYFAGEWDWDKNIVQELSNPSTANTTSFNLPSLLLDPEEIISPIADMMGIKSVPLTALLMELKDFLDWDVLTIPKDSVYSVSFKANNSPIGLAILQKRDISDYHRNEAIFGWKVLKNAQRIEDYTEFYEVLLSIIKPMDCWTALKPNTQDIVDELNDLESIKSSDGSISIDSAIPKINDIKNKLKSKPLPVGLWLLNSVFGNTIFDTNKSPCKKNGKDNVPKNTRNTPLNHFFKVLLGKKISLSRQFSFGYSSIFYEVEENIENVWKEAQKQLETDSKKTPVANTQTDNPLSISFSPVPITNLSSAWKNPLLGDINKWPHPFFPAAISPSNQGFRRISDSWIFNAWSSYPEPPLIFSHPVWTDLNITKIFKQEKYNSPKKLEIKKNEIGNEILQALLQNKWMGDGSFLPVLNQHLIWTLEEKTKNSEPIKIYKSENSNDNKPTELSLIKSPEIIVSPIETSFYFFDVAAALRAVISMESKALKSSTMISAAALVKTILIPTLLDNNPLKNPGIICINLGQESGIWTAIHSTSFRLIKYWGEGEIIGSIPPDFDKSKLNLFGLVTL